MDWKQELLKRLDALAEKLGTTASYLWYVLCKQAYITGITDLIVGLLLLGVVLGGIKALYVLGRGLKDTDDAFPWGAGIVVTGLVMVVCSVASVCNLTLAMQELLNPEYYALHEVLQTLGK